ncbi:MAG: hypothetical protein MN733_04885, partial [Nitrososphaera sp.]|nr:hypothetical protein [Nitrososphaera sp.]
MSGSEARFTINVKEGIVELEGKESFVDRHLERFEEIFKTAVKEAITRGLEQSAVLKAPSAAALTQEASPAIEQINQRHEKAVIGGAKHGARTPPAIHPIPVDLKPGDGKMGLREFYAEKKPSN